jgi:hypothetical protein
VTEKLDEGGGYPWDPPSVRSVLADAGWHQRPVWLTETGVQSDEYGETGQEQFYLGLLGEWFGENRSETWLGRVFFYEMEDPGQPFELSWGVLGPPPDRLRKLAYYAYASFIETSVVDDAEVELTGVPPVMGSMESADLQVVVRNTGTTTWRADDGYAAFLEVDQPSWITSLEPVAVSAPVEPGGSEVLGGRINSPAIAVGDPNREVAVSVRIVKIGEARFGDVARRIVVHTPHELPEIVVGPEATSVPFNGSAELSVSVVSDTDAVYRWRRHTAPLEDDHRISGATGPVLTVGAIGYGDVGDYDCVITNAAGRVLTDPVSVTIAGSPVRRPAGRVAGQTTGTVVRWLEFRIGPGRGDAHRSAAEPRRAESHGR